VVGVATRAVRSLPAFRRSRASQHGARWNALRRKDCERHKYRDRYRQRDRGTERGTDRRANIQQPRLMDRSLQGLTVVQSDQLNNWHNYTIRYKSLTWTQKLSIQLNLAHVVRKNIKKKLKQTNASAPLIQYRLSSVKAVRKEED